MCDGISGLITGAKPCEAGSGRGSALDKTGCHKSDAVIIDTDANIVESVCFMSY